MKKLLQFLAIPLVTAIFIFLAIIVEEIFLIGFEIAGLGSPLAEAYSQITVFLVLSALAEEIIKFLFLFFFLKRQFEKERNLFFLGAILFSIFWGLIEIFLLSWKWGGSIQLGSLTTRQPIALSLASLLFLHFSTVLFMASAFWKKEGGIAKKMARAVPFPFSVHVLYNFLIINSGPYTPILLVALLAITFSVSTARILPRLWSPREP